jgi:hypothetical protein
MIFPNRVKDPRAMMSIGMMFLVIALVWPRFFHATANFSPNLMDGVRGMLFGIAIGMNLWSVKLAARQRRSSRS